MKGLKIYSKGSVQKLITTRKGETKFGEGLQYVEDISELKDHQAHYVLLGIAEDIGIRANHGKPGASGAWKAALKSLLNIQKNRFNNSENIILLGEIDCSLQMNKASNIDREDPNYFQKLGDLVKEIDELVTEVIEKIISAGKIPIIIGGGHNNAYGNIKASAKALKDPINVINIDAHTDLRQLEHRHSGNGFSYAIEGGYLRKYHVFGLHKNYTPEYIFEEMDRSENLNFDLYETLNQNQIRSRFQEALKTISLSNFGFELDCDAIANFPSSAVSPSGFSMQDVRYFIKTISRSKNCCYFHICEAATNTENSTSVGKSLAYFVSDFIK